METQEGRKERMEGMKGAMEVKERQGALVPPVINASQMPVTGPINTAIRALLYNIQKQRGDPRCLRACELPTINRRCCWDLRSSVSPHVPSRFSVPLRALVSCYRVAPCSRCPPPLPVPQCAVPVGHCARSFCPVCYYTKQDRAFIFRFVFGLLV
jgi:hypothetical protein